MAQEITPSLATMPSVEQVATWLDEGELVIVRVVIRVVHLSSRSVRSEVNNSLIIVNFFHKIQNFRQISDLFSQI